VAVADPTFDSTPKLEKSNPHLFTVCFDSGDMAAKKVDISAIACAMDEVEVAIRAVRDRLPIDGLFDICARAPPSTAGRHDLREIDKCGTSYL